MLDKIRLAIGRRKNAQAKILMLELICAVDRLKYCSPEDRAESIKATAAIAKRLGNLID